jgi:hypothetical protein
VVIAEYCAGGGYGDPLDRDIASLQQDLADGNVTPATAAAEYGAVLAGGKTIDGPATERRRHQVRQDRLSRAVPREVAADSDLEPDSHIRQRVHGGLELRRYGQQWVWVCSHCRHRLAGAEVDYRRGCARLDLDPPELDDRRYPDPGRFFPIDLVFRQWLCPACGRGLATDIARRGESPVQDVKLDLTSCEAAP